MEDYLLMRVLAYLVGSIPSGPILLAYGSTEVWQS